MRKLFLLPIAGLLALAACRKKDAEDTKKPEGANTFKMEFSNVARSAAGLEPLTLDTKWYVTAGGDSVRITAYKYYISNISLMADDGSTYTEPDSYHLINQDDADSRKIAIANVPAGNYTRVKFMIGVDSARNADGSRAFTGDLDPVMNMYWSWSTGFIMAKLEGNSPRINNVNGDFFLHAGGYAGQYATQRWVTLDLPVKATISSSSSPNVHIFSDAMEWFKTPNAWDLATTPMVMSAGPNAVRLADNYADMFEVDHVD